MSTATTGGDPVPLLLVDNAITLEDGYFMYLERILNLQTGRTDAATQLVYNRDEEGLVPCGTSIRRNGAPEFASAGGPPLRYVKGRWNLLEKEWLWQLPWPTKAERGFDAMYCSEASMDAGGRNFYFCGNVLRASLQPGSSEIEELDRPGDFGFYLGAGAGLDDIVAWPEMIKARPGARIRAWRPDGKGIRTMLDDIPVDACKLGISDTHVAGFSAANGCDSFQHDARLWTAERTRDDRLIDFRLGPAFWPEGVSTLWTPVTWGDHVAVVWLEADYESQSDRQRLLLARTTDWAMRQLRGPDGMEVWAATLGDDYLYVAFTRVGAETGRFSWIYRYDLDQFDQIGVAVEPLPDPP